MLNLCGAMDFPTSGSVLIEGVDTSRLDDTALTRVRREKIGFVFQSFQLLHTLTAIENVELPLLLARTPEPGARRWSVCAGSRCTRTPIGIHISSPEASSSGLRSQELWRVLLDYFSLTSLPATSTAGRANSC